MSSVDLWMSPLYLGMHMQSHNFWMNYSFNCHFFIINGPSQQHRSVLSLCIYWFFEDVVQSVMLNNTQTHTVFFFCTSSVLTGRTKSRSTHKPKHTRWPFHVLEAIYSPALSLLLSAGSNNIYTVIFLSKSFQMQQDLVYALLKVW